MKRKFRIIPLKDIPNQYIIQIKYKLFWRSEIGENISPLSFVVYRFDLTNAKLMLKFMEISEYRRNLWNTNPDSILPSLPARGKPLNRCFNRTRTPTS